MKISARNRLKGTIVEVTKGATTAHVRIDIGNGSVIAAGSIVLGNVEPGTTVAGVPATPRVRNERSFAGF